MMTIEQLVVKAKEDGASDIHIICGLPPKYRKSGDLENMAEEIVTEDYCMQMAKELSKTEKAFDELMIEGELDAADSYAGNRCRIHLFKQQGVPSLALRILSENIPQLENLGLPIGVLDLPKLHKGIVLVTGETGSGKSTTLAAILDNINHNYKRHIVTLEDPIEYMYKPDLCAINQREVGKDTKSFAMGLRASLREDPNVILIGEMRDRDTIETAITAAETGHLVFGTLHTGSAADSVDRMVQVFPEAAQPQIRLQLSMVLQAVLTQQLIQKKGGGRALAAEYMIVTDAIRNLIRTGNTPQIANAVATSAEIGGQTMDQALIRLVKNGLITRDNALHYAVNKEFVDRNIMY
ncbi:MULTISPECIES: type IV pilus twitching motility protein PilT [unclassified Butyrivibrio]|uniref:type IV pilus twitching motility protein PilT n=1 Tax=unclassified Butyrivibrio TaxID=2639466 RepID=UPI0003FD54EA|nr:MULTISPECIES: PilT/PilU family type 4a pilus ATPase [unclassified Butyrivibrio]